MTRRGFALTAAGWLALAGIVLSGPCHPAALVLALVACALAVYALH